MLDSRRSLWVPPVNLEIALFEHDAHDLSEQLRQRFVLLQNQASKLYKLLKTAHNGLRVSIGSTRQDEKSSNCVSKTTQLLGAV